VAHLTGVSHPKRATPEELMRVNVTGTFIALEAAVRPGAGKVVLAATDATLGVVFAVRPESPAYLPVDEEHPLRSG
jgi:nucleoside-diphosphate-sugar epimerase